MLRRIAQASLAAVIAAAFSASLAPMPASADQACYKASTSGSVPGVHTFGPYCQPTSLTLHCRYQEGGVGTLAGVRIEFCLPLL